MASESDPHPRRNGKLRIPLPFEDALKAATEVPADKLAKPNGQKRKRGRKTETRK